MSPCFLVISVKIGDPEDKVFIQEWARAEFTTTSRRWPESGNLERNYFHGNKRWWYRTSESSSWCQAGERTVSSDGQNLQQFWGSDTDESIDKEDHSGSACQIDIIPGLYSVDSRTSSTGTRPVTPEPVGRLTGHQLHLNQEASQEDDLVGETCPSVTDDATENSDNFQQVSHWISSFVSIILASLQVYCHMCCTPYVMSIWNYLAPVIRIQTLTSLIISTSFIKINYWFMHIIPI